MPSWTPKDDSDLLIALIASKGASGKALCEDLAKRMDYRFSAEAIRQKFIRIHRDHKARSLESTDEKSPDKSPPTVAKRRPRVEKQKKKKGPKRGKSSAPDLTPSPSPAGHEIETPSKSRPARRGSKKSYKVDSVVSTPDSDMKTSTPVEKTDMNDSDAELSEEIKFEEDEMDFGDESFL